jgi:uncharacterized membrane protein
MRNALAQGSLRGDVNLSTLPDAEPIEPDGRIIRYFAISAFVLGSLFAFSNPPLCAPDEPDHFAKAWQVSHLHFVGDIHDSVKGGWVPKGIANLETQSYSGSWTVVRFQSFHDLEVTPSTTFLPFPSISNYPPFPYIPQAIGIRFGELFSKSALALMYFGREANLVSYILLTCFALRLAADLRAQVFLSVVALIPMGLYEAASLSADGTTIAMSLVFAGAIYQAVNTTKNSSILLVASGTILSLTKMAYLPMLLALFVIPRERFGDSPKKLLFIAVVVASNVLLVFAWVHHLGHISLSTNPKVDGSRQIAYLRRSPDAIPGIVLNTLKRVPGILGSVIGAFGFGDRFLPRPELLGYWALLIYLAFKRPKNICWKNLGVIALIYLMELILIAALTYVFWAAVGQKYIPNLQGRYLIPLLPLLILALHKGATEKATGRSEIQWFSAAVMLTTFSIVCFAQNYYQHFPRPDWWFPGR